MSVAVFPLGPLETNCYIVSYEGQAVAIDVGGDPAPVSKYLKEHGLELKAICITHMHFDHLYGVAALAAETQFPAAPKFESVSIEPGNKTEFAGLECKVLSVPGHTPGSVAYYFKKEKCVFVGDTLFLESIGRTDFPFSSHEQLVTSIRSELFSLPDDTIVYPGHGPETSIGYEKGDNACRQAFVFPKSLLFQNIFQKNRLSRAT